jgi:hypothetical protein
MRIGDFFPILDQKHSQNLQPEVTDRPTADLDGIRLAVGQLIKARVSEVGLDGKLFLTMAGKTIPVRSEVSLKPGQDIWLEVREVKPQPRLTLAAGKGTVHDFLRQFLAEGTGIGRAATMLSGLETGVETNQLTRLLTLFPLLGNLLEGLQGGNADVIALIDLLNALRRQAEKGPPPGAPSRPESLSAFSAGQIKEFQSGITSHAEKMLSELAPLRAFLAATTNLNTLSFGKDGPPFLFFPCFFADNAGWGEWVFQHENASADHASAETPYRLSFFLTMSSLGDLHVDVSVSGKSLRGTLLVGNREVRDHIAEALPELQQLLRATGFDSVTLTCAVTRTGLPQAIKETVGQAAGLGSTSLLDVTA